MRLATILFFLICLVADSYVAAYLTAAAFHDTAGMRVFFVLGIACNFYTAYVLIRGVAAISRRAFLTR